jgi:acyl-CoA dehydrogenase
VSVFVTKPSLEDFKKEITAFLDARAAIRDSTGVSTIDGRALTDRFRDAKAWQRQRFDAGLGWIVGPMEYGGRELSPEYERLYRRTEAGYDVPDTGHLGQGLTIIASAILGHSSAQGKEKFLPGLFRGDIVACQLFSEPSAGSDLAGVRTTARRDGKEWVITGQKVWTTNAHLADVGECVCRTNPGAPKHKGITIFMVDMHSAGVDVRPLRDASGDVHFNEVFLTDVRVSDVEDRVGPVDDGWRVLNTSLMEERAFVGASNAGRRNVLTPELLASTLREIDRLGDPLVRDCLADLFVRFRTAEYETRQTNERLERGEIPGPEMSAAKLTFSDNQQRLVNLAADALGAHITAATENAETWQWAARLLRGRAARIAGGTDEVQRTILAERVLGLPRDPAIDNALPFNRVAASGRHV